MKNILKILFTPFWWTPVTGWCGHLRIPKNGDVSDRSYNIIYRKGKILRIIEIREIEEK